MYMETTITISKAAEMLGVTVHTLQRWDREGRLTPVARTQTNRRVYTVDQIRAFQGLRLSGHAPTRVVAYCRVSSPAQKPDLDNQRVVLEQFCAARGRADIEVISEIGGGLNFTRKKFVALMQAVDRYEVKTIVIAHKDRLVRFGFVWFANFCADHGCELLVLNQETLSPEQEVVQDLMTIVHCFSSRLYGLRNYRKTLTEALKGPQA
jgi:putative resolvase